MNVDSKSISQWITAPCLLITMVVTAAPAMPSDDGNQPPITICDQPYALCTSAPCIPDPDDPENQAICSCIVQDGESLGQTSCPDRAKKTVDLVYAGKPDNLAGDQHETLTIRSATELLTSTFSCNELGSKDVMLCPAGYPWTDCLDAPCTVNPSDPSEAICRCPIVREAPFLTLGGNCNPQTCANSYWSAATIPMMEGSAQFCADNWKDYVCSDQ